MGSLEIRWDRGNRECHVQDRKAPVHQTGHVKRTPDQMEE